MERKEVVTRAFRLSREVVRELQLESFTRKMNGLEPSSQQAIVEEALWAWFRLKDEEPEIKKLAS